EAQVVLPRYAGDLAQLLAEAAAGEIRSEPMWDERAAVTVVLASEGYPLSPRTGDPISGLDEAGSLPGVTVYSAGLGPGRTTAGGRVLNVTALGADLPDARRRAYEAVSKIHWPGMHYRHDIAEAAAASEVRV
ncbi:MAG TPA: phosphoribosylglycinamide synthetase C domain-containing protein, partial [Acidimicrobiales bacterium]